MSDHKFERDEDREVTPSEIKNRLIVLMENGFEMPEVHIYDEPVRYLKMNLEWFKIFSGWLSWMEHPSFWKDAEDYDFEAIQQILLFEEGIEAAMATKEDIRDGMYEALNRLALQIVSGTYADLNISTDEDGAVTSGSGSGDTPVVLPEDDPATDYDDTEAALYGAIYEISEQMEKVLDKIDTLYGATNNSPTTLEASAQQIMAALYPCDVTAMNQAVTAYYAWRVSNGRIIFEPDATWPQYMYCNGYGYNEWAKYLLEIVTFPIAKVNIMLGFWAALTEYFFDGYFEKGSAKPNTAYLDAACVPIAYQEFTNVPFGSARTTTPLKANHRMRIRITGYSTDAGDSPNPQDIQDAFWYTNSTTGVRTRTNPTFTHSAGTNLPSDNQIVYNNAHAYDYTIDLQNLNNVMVITMNKAGGMSASATNPLFRIQIWDLGLAVSQ